MKQKGTPSLCEYADSLNHAFNGKMTFQPSNAYVPAMGQHDCTALNVLRWSGSGFEQAYQCIDLGNPKQLPKHFLGGQKVTVDELRSTKSSKEVADLIAGIAETVGWRFTVFQWGDLYLLVNGRTCLMIKPMVQLEPLVQVGGMVVRADRKGLRAAHELAVEAGKITFG